MAYSSRALGWLSIYLSLSYILTFYLFLFWVFKIVFLFSLVGVVGCIVYEHHKLDELELYSRGAGDRKSDGRQSGLHARASFSAMVFRLYFFCDKLYHHHQRSQVFMDAMVRWRAPHNPLDGCGSPNNRPRYISIVPALRPARPLDFRRNKLDSEAIS